MSDFHNDCMRTAAGPGVFHYADSHERMMDVANDATFRASDLGHVEEAQGLIDEEFIEDAVDFLAAAAKIDRWKSRFFYNKDKELPDFDHFLEGEMSLEFIVNPQLIHGILGVATEGAELVEALLKMMRGDTWQKATDDNGTAMASIVNNIVEENGDVDWFQELIAEAIGVPVDQSREGTIAKLRKRYPDKFNESDGVARADKADA